MAKTEIAWVEKAWEQITKKVGRTSDKIGANFPHASVNGEYKLEPPHWWTAGFWPGLLWLVHRDGGDQKLKTIAEKCEQQLDKVITDYYRLDHDMGFMWTLTSLTNYKLTGSEHSKRRALLVANLLLGRFNTNGNFIRAWNPWYEGEENSGWAIIDCLMNLPLLYWASDETEDPRFRNAARKHADTVLEYFVRADGAVHHIVRFDSETGEHVENIGGQGYAENSAWSRGTAWAIYGLALSYHYTGDERYLQGAKKVAHFFLAHLPEDMVPHWDMHIPEDVPTHRDSSAGAIAASGLLLLGEKAGVIAGEAYLRAGMKILKSLYVNYGDWENQHEDGLILHGTSHYPERSNVDVPLIYGDYYFVEGLARLKGYEGLF
ncbi:glycoside hydrolase family 88 protein [Paenalkalicoccus suaedae]|uniref:Glycoside hydrolase family 88 protein n=1 Tax=Paenalkalicoccus suaedae TaxID=2592382 RepID=A0A859FDG4_9BACI|nr:glycoside hydrolase family 88 protein [Paenalkalicoccus suaedae]QKS70295.1 glycoside hydrolase family 88 protein [Paenalkalicoccus suaedae]